MKSLVVKRSIFPAGRKTSVSLEDEFWNALKKIASDRNVTLSELVGDIDAQRRAGLVVVMNGPNRPLLPEKPKDGAAN